MNALRRAWKYIAAALAGLVAVAGALVTLRWVRRGAPTDTARRLAGEDVYRAERAVDDTRAGAEAAARERAALRATEAAARARELSRGAVSDPDGVLDRHRRPPGEDPD